MRKRFIVIVTLLLVSFVAGCDGFEDDWFVNPGDVLRSPVATPVPAHKPKPKWDCTDGWLNCRLVWE